MNNVSLIGRIAREPEMRYYGDDGVIARYTLAVDRGDKDHNADFINCICFGKTAEFAENYLFKGTKIGVIGRIQTGSYTNKEGNKVYTSDVVVNSHYFCESKNTNYDNVEADDVEEDEEFVPVDEIEKEIPFPTTKKATKSTKKATKSTRSTARRK